MEDMAILTGGTVISEEVGRKLDSVSVDDLGKARRVVSTKEETTFVDGAGAENAIQGRINQTRPRLTKPLRILIEKNCKRDWLSFQVV